ncbi:MAG: metallophosphoesterase [Candidatus Hinthialibacter antarcticus]|nr:metallophosphoesterase [Candidatus Hinthialibacter antarcticus]
MKPLYEITRRDWLSYAGAAFFASAFSSSAFAQSALRFGVVTDAHYCDCDPRGSRHYRESIAKMRECVEFMNEQQVEFLVELGDLKDQDDKPVEEKTLRYLTEIEAEFQRFNGPRFHVLGNHDLDSIAKPQYLERIVNSGIDRERSFYSFDQGGVHFVVLDACFTSSGADYDHGNFDWTDANIPPKELDWLTSDLQNAPGPCVVFVHQLLDGEGSVFIKNAEQVRGVLEESGKVKAVFQGHHHDGQYNKINDVHYYTLKAMVEGSGEDNNSYAIVEVKPDGLLVTGYRKAVSKTFD